jgi:hypothetical protein
MTKQSSDLVQLLSVNNFIPILVTIITVVIFVVGLGARIDLLDQKIDYIIVAQDKLLEKYANIEEKYGNLALQVKAIETSLQIK